MAIIYGEGGPRWRQILSRKSRVISSSERLKSVFLKSRDDESTVHDSKPSAAPRSSFSGLPFDIALEIILHLDVKDVLSIARVNRFFYEVSRAAAVWQKLAHDLMCRGRRLSLQNLLMPTELSSEQMRSSVLKSVAAEHNWLREFPKKVSASRLVKLDRDIVLDQLSYVMKYASPRHIVLPTTDGDLVGWDMNRGVALGRYNMGRQSVLINVQGHYASRSLYWITGRYTGFENDNMNLNLKLVILRVQFPDPDSDDSFVFEELQQMLMPCFFAVELHFLDTARRMLCSVFTPHENGSTGLIVILDWQTNLCAVVDIDLPYEYGRTIIGIQLSEDGEHIVIHSNDSGEEVCRFYPLSVIRNYASLWDPAMRTSGDFPKIFPSREIHSKWEHELPALAQGHLVPHTVWVLPQWWPTYPDVPLRTSTIILYISVDRAIGGRTRTWRAVQHYSYASGTAESSAMSASSADDTTSISISRAGPCTTARCVVEIDDPVLIPLGEHGLPILAHSFNHLGWIEEREVEVDVDGDEPEDTDTDTDAASQQISSRFSSSRKRLSGLVNLLTLRKGKKGKGKARKVTRKRRALKMVTFPDPGVSPANFDSDETDGKPSTFMRPVTLDVPEHVLNEAYHIFIDPAVGTVTVATISNALHVFPYS